MGNFIVLAREKFREYRIGCCGLARKDMIYPIGKDTLEKDFVKEAYSMVESYGIGTLDRVDDTYSIEYFLGEPEQNFRENGKSLMLLELEEDKKWHYYKDNIEMFAVETLEELRHLWEPFLK